MAESPELDVAKTEEGQVEDPKVEPTDPQEPSARDKIDNILKAHGVSSPDDLTSIIDEASTWKQKYGASQSGVGELRRQIEDLQNQLSNTQRMRPPQNSYDDDYAEHGVNLTESLRPVIQDEILKAYQTIAQTNQQVTNYWMQQRSEIEQMPNWERLQPEFDRALQNPNVLGMVQSGQLTMKDVYHRMNTKFLMSELQSLKDSLPEGAELKATGQASVGTGENIPIRGRTEEERKEAIKRAKDQKNPMAVLDNLLGDDNDPMLNIG